MRKIEFRAKNSKTGKWLTGELFSYMGNTIIKDSNFTFIDLIGHPEDFAIDTSTIGQYTGVTDSFGKQIFEGDELEVCYDGETSEHIVEFVFGGFMIEYSGYYDEGDYMPICEETLSNSDYQFKVIGTIYDK